MPLFDIFKRKQETRSQNTNENAHLEVENPCLVGDLGLLGGIFDKLKDPMSLSAVFGCINLISNSVGAMPMHIRAYPDVDIKYDDFLPRVMMNSNMTKFLFMKQLIFNVISQGNGYAYIVRNDNGKIEKLIWLNPQSVTIFYDPTSLEIKYYISTQLPQIKQILPQDIIHLKMYSKDGVMGRSVLDFANDTIDIAGYVQTTTKNYYKSGTQLTGILTLNNSNPNLNVSQKKLDELKTAWNQGSARSSDGSTIRILTADMKYTPISGNASDSQLIQNRTFSIDEICRYFNISPVLLGQLEHSSYANNIEAAQIEFVYHALAPWVEMVQHEFSKKLLPNEMLDKLYVNLDEDYLLKADKKSFAEYLSKLANAGIVTRNECRKFLGLETIDNEMADDLLIPFTDTNMNTVNENKNEQKEQETEQKEQEDEDDTTN